MRSFRLILLTIWISTSTANPYPQNDSIGQGSNSNSLTTESDSASSDQLGLYNTDEDNNTLESCRIDGTTKATKVRRQSCSNTAVQAPPKPKIKVPEPEPETTVKKEQPNSEPKLDLGSVIPPSQRPPKKYAYQGPCPWPFKQFLCCLESLMVPGQNLLGCWHCASLSLHLSVNHYFPTEPNTF